MAPTNPPATAVDASASDLATLLAEASPTGTIYVYIDTVGALQAPGLTAAATKAAVTAVLDRAVGTMQTLALLRAKLTTLPHTGSFYISHDTSTPSGAGISVDDVASLLYNPSDPLLIPARTIREAQIWGTPDDKSTIAGSLPARMDIMVKMNHTVTKTAAWIPLASTSNEGKYVKFDDIELVRD